MTEQVRSLPIAVPEVKKKDFYVPWHRYGRIPSADAECRTVPPLRPVREEDVLVLLKYRHMYQHDWQTEPSPRPVKPPVGDQWQDGEETAQQKQPQPDALVVAGGAGKEREEEGRGARRSRGLLRRLLACCCCCIQLPRGRGSRTSNRVHPEVEITPTCQANAVSPAIPIPGTYTRQKHEQVSAWVLRHFGSTQQRCRWLEGLRDGASSTAVADVTYCEPFSYTDSGE